MFDNSTPPTSGDASPAACACGARTIPNPLVGGVEQHSDGCALFDRSRERRERDLAELADAPAGVPLLRRLDPSEADDVAAAVGHSVRGRAEVRRWRVRCTAVDRGGIRHLARMFVRDGEPRGALIDSGPAEVVGAQR